MIVRYGCRVTIFAKGILQLASLEIQEVPEIFPTYCIGRLGGKIMAGGHSLTVRLRRGDQFVWVWKRHQKGKV